MDREELKALLDERGIEYSPHAHTPTLVDLALGEEKGGEVAEATSEEVETQTAEEEAPFYQPQVFSPWELPANTVAAQQYMDRGLVVDETLVPPDDVLAAANNEIELHGHPDDPRLQGGSLVGFNAQALPSREVEIEEPEEVDLSGQTWGQKLAAEAETEEVSA